MYDKLWHPIAWSLTSSALIASVLHIAAYNAQAFISGAIVVAIGQAYSLLRHRYMDMGQVSSGSRMVAKLYLLMLEKWCITILGTAWVLMHTTVQAWLVLCGFAFVLLVNRAWYTIQVIVNRDTD